jgi:hypothetical protein
MQADHDSPHNRKIFQSRLARRETFVRYTFPRPYNVCLFSACTLMWFATLVLTLQLYRLQA